MGSSPEWYLILNGENIGPLTPEQIRDLLGTGKIRADHWVTAPKLQGKSITAQEVIKTLGTLESPASPSLQLPSRPTKNPEVSQDPNGPGLIDPTHPDPVHGLFDVLQATREKRNFTVGPSSPPSSSSSHLGWTSFLFKLSLFSNWKWSMPPWLVASILLFLSLSVWGIARVLKKASTSTVPSGKSAPVQAVAPSSPAQSAPPTSAAKPVRLEVPRVSGTTVNKKPVTIFAPAPPPPPPPPPEEVRETDVNGPSDQTPIDNFVPPDSGRGFPNSPHDPAPGPPDIHDPRMRDPRMPYDPRNPREMRGPPDSENPPENPEYSPPSD